MKAVPRQCGPLGRIRPAPSTRSGVRMDRPARLFLCAGCRVQVVLCSRCDRGNLYCGRPCWRRARDVARREAARRYQRSPRGIEAHAERSRRWRERRRAALRVGVDVDKPDDAGAQKSGVTHQGWPAQGVGAPLVACTHHTTSSDLDHSPSAPAPKAVSTSTPATPATPSTISAMPTGTLATPAAPATAPWYCRRCARPQPALLRQGFVRHGLSRPASIGRRHDHSP